MYDLIRDFPAQLRDSLKIGDAATIHTTLAEPVRHVLVCGLGGSGIGGDLAREVLRNDLEVPLAVNKGYFLPGYVNHHTLVILCSYSGNTEETLSVAEECKLRGYKPIVITSGGKLRDLAAQEAWDTILIPPGLPPRACIGYSALQIFFILYKLGLIGDSFITDTLSTAHLLYNEQTEIQNETRALAEKLLRKIIILYTEDTYESVALRIKQQINENAKMHCWYNAVPEVNHNELVGWRQTHDNLAVIFLLTGNEFQRNHHRIQFMKGLIDGLKTDVYEVTALGNNLFEKHFYLIHWGDWLSYYLAELQGHDPTEVTEITNLKKHLEGIRE
ncbi:MAG: bifunctional phosphoglucose/phosphomannose isomerase [Chitinophagales bacterium]|nr:bifunctional phosphoglucose/phosphomannose isomerase [Chitinophagales bacterium]MDW8419781.1 bifunctional phosphoglucose/phosphomannose isomerase [Chitinophagales bacterium]